MNQGGSLLNSTTIQNGLINICITELSCVLFGINKETSKTIAYFSVAEVSVSFNRHVVIVNMIVGRNMAAGRWSSQSDRPGYGANEEGEGRW